MPGYQSFQVKCEPTSEDEDSNSQYSHNYLNNQSITSELRPIKLEPVSQREEHVRAASAHLLHHLQGPSSLEELAPLAPAPAGPAATPVCVKHELPAEPPPPAMLETLHAAPPHANTTQEELNCDALSLNTEAVLGNLLDLDLPLDFPGSSTPSTSVQYVKLQEDVADNSGCTLIDRHMSMLHGGDVPDSADFMPLLAVKDEPLSEGEQQALSGDDASDSSSQLEPAARASPKSWTQRDMDGALEALRTHNMSLTKASATYGIPSTTLWQRAHRLGIDTPKKEGAAKSWGEGDLRRALHALRAGAISANKASKAYGIPSSTLYKIARREGIRLAAPFNAAPTAWRRADLERALASIRCGASSVQRAATQFGIPTGTLYGRCKREGIELSRSNPTPWSEDAMGEALEAVRVGQMSINQAAIHYNLPYSSLYGRFKRCKYQAQGFQPMQQDMQKPHEMEHHQTHDPNQYYHQAAPPHATPHLAEDQAPALDHHTQYYQQVGEQEGLVQDQYSQAMYYAQCNMAS